MFTRSELEIKNLGELRGLCKQYGLKPLGNPGYKTAWIDALLTFTAIALRQMKEGEGLTRIPRAFVRLRKQLTQIPTDTNFRQVPKGWAEVMVCDRQHQSTDYQNNYNYRPNSNP